MELSKLQQLIATKEKKNFTLPVLREMFKTSLLNYYRGATTREQLATLFIEIIDILPALHPLATYLILLKRDNGDQVYAEELFEMVLGHIIILEEYNQIPKDR